MKNIMIAIGKLTGGGAERVATVWANHLASFGYKVSILALFKEDNEYNIQDNINVNYISRTREDFSLLSPFDRFFSFRRIIRQEKPDCIITFLPNVQMWIMLATLGMNIKRIETVRNNLEMEQFPNPFQRNLWKLCYSTCSRIILQSQDQAQFLSKHQQRKCTVIPNPISDIYLQSFNQKASHSNCRFIAVGRIHEQKNYPLMIKSFAHICKKYPHTTLNIYGNGKNEYVASIKALIEHEGMSKNIFLPGRTNRIEEEYRNNDIFLMTSDYEGMPNTLAEAMASKLVCIATDCKTGPRDLIDDGINGFLVPVGDETQLQDKMEYVLTLSREKRDDIASSARKKILSYCSKENSVQKLIDMLDEL